MDVRSTILSLFPQARITSGYRDPKSRLGRANPRSYHNIDRAYDVAPIPGVTFDDYVSRLKGAGVNIVEALDEQRHPRPHTTGPNWHIAYGDAKPMPRSPNFAAMSQVAGGFDPLAPDPIRAALMPQPAQPNFAAMSQPLMGHDPLAPQQGKRKFNGAAILGIIGDALAAYGGQRGVFAPMMAQQRADEADDNRFQQRLDAEIEMRRQAALAKAAEPPPWLRDAMIFNQLPGDQKQMVLDQRNAMFPVIADIAQPDGSVFRQQINRQIPQSAPQPGTVEEGFVFMGGDPADPNNWRQQ